jgi:RHH-type proline utilization regulon transcriptional repressor/proline dehydrogenase/delta 1-pyrroline-5-carboxylate dehydrogenase
MIWERDPPEPSPLRRAVRRAYRADETACVRSLVEKAQLSKSERERTQALAARLVQAVRAKGPGAGLDAFLQEYALSSAEGVALMCLAEALLRIPDADTADKLIRDKIGGAAWEKHLGHSPSLFVNASTWALMLTGRLVKPADDGDWGSLLTGLVGRAGEPAIRAALTQAMRILGRQFVMGRTIGEALGRARDDEANGYRHSYDMLGEAARTMRDAERYFESYRNAIAAIGKAARGADVAARPGISVKLSALHPRYEFAQVRRVMAELLPRVTALAAQAKAANLGFCIDAEEADRLDLSLDVIEALALDPALAGWNGFGLAAQAYQKRALALIDWLADLARRAGRRLMLRLVKGAYWDAEIKRAQEGGHADYPVFTRKSSTDVSYLACAKALLARPDAFYPQFATHNAHTLAAVLTLAGDRRDFEFQRLHGMGEALYDEVVGPERMGLACRVYAPVGGHEELLAYLVRRLLENGANTSFVNRLFDEREPVAHIVADPVEETAALGRIPHPAIPRPPELYGARRRNAAGLDLTDLEELVPLKRALAAAAQPARLGAGRTVTSPANRSVVVGEIGEANAADVDSALAALVRAAPAWDATPAGERGAILRRAADLMEADRPALLALCVREAGKTLPDAVAEVREAVDYLRYYALRAEDDFAAPERLPGPTGERNEIELHGRGVFACISPWNFPLAIFTGQVSAALAAGNAVAAKPAEQTPLVAARAVRLLHEAGVPADVLHLLAGDGPTVGAPLVNDPRVAGIAFTGSTETARAIQRSLAAREGPIVPLIAETGGQNAMIVDSSALPEQVVADAVVSAFHSVGQRCSALRVLFVQEEVADRTVEMLIGAMRELGIGDPALLSTDVGPVIDDEARAALTAHAERMKRQARLLFEAPLPAEAARGSFFPPTAFELDRLALLEREVFGPILHVIRWRADRLDAVIDAINATGYGLTFGLHSRIDETIAHVRARVRAGNLYVNRTMIGAVVGVQPFGGEGLSGTGPKAGGPRYLHRFATERTVSINTTAAGGNAALLAMSAEDQ